MTPEDDFNKGKNLLENIWKILETVPAPLADHKRRAAALEWLQTRLEKLRDLETPLETSQDENSK